MGVMAVEKKHTSEGAQCIKYLMFVFNLLFFMAGCALLGCGIWIAVDRNFMTPIMGTTLYAGATFVVITGGGIIILIAFLGCCGAITENKCMVLTFTIFLSLLFVLLFLGGILAVVFRTQLTEKMRDHMGTTLREEYGVDTHNKYNQAVTDAWNTAQEKLECCAVITNGWTVYRDSLWFKRQPESNKASGGRQQKFVPPSCCRKDHGTGRYLDQDRCQKWSLGPPGRPDGGENYALFYKGCYEAGKEFVLEHSGILIGIGIGAAILMIMGIIFSIMTYRIIQD